MRITFLSNIVSNIIFQLNLTSKNTGYSSKIPTNSADNTSDKSCGFYPTSKPRFPPLTYILFNAFAEATITVFKRFF